MAPREPRPAPAQPPPKLIRAVDETEEAGKAVRRLAQSAQGYVSAVRAQRQQRPLHYGITLQVPQRQLDLPWTVRLGEPGT